jgi:hypothetical protein
VYRSDSIQRFKFEENGIFNDDVCNVVADYSAMERNEDRKLLDGADPVLVEKYHQGILVNLSKKPNPSSV